MNRTRYTLTWRFIAIILVVVTGFLSLPFLGSFLTLSTRIFANDYDSFRTTLISTLYFALITSFILVVAGFIGALFLNKIMPASKLGKTFALFIFPIILGSISICFITKLIVGDSSIFSWVVEKGGLYRLGFLILLQVWQYGILFIYLFWMQIKSIPLSTLNYASACSFSMYQYIKDIYIPACKNLWILLVCVGFTTTLYDESKLQYLFKASKGTDSEMISNWLNRNYQSTLLLNTENATELIFNTSALTTICAIVAIILIFLVSNKLFELMYKIKTYPSLKPFNYNQKKKAGVIWGICLMGIVITPVIHSFFLLNVSFGSVSSELIFTLAMTSLATVTAVVVAVILGISARLGWQTTLGSFNRQSLIFFVGLYLLLLIPPIAILLCGYKWMAIIGYKSKTAIYIIWVLGHTLLALPTLGSFLLFNHFRVTTNEINYQQVNSLSKIEIMYQSFLRRFKAEYSLLIIVGFSFIWNESVLNNLFSDYIPAFVNGLKMLITGRGADYSMASGYLFVSLTLAFAATGLWRFIIGKGLTDHTL